MTTPKMRAYAALVAAARVRKKFEEEKVKRDSSGKFAKKAGTKVSTSRPSKSSAGPSTSGKAKRARLTQPTDTSDIGAQSNIGTHGHTTGQIVDTPKSGSHERGVVVDVGLQSGGKPRTTVQYPDGSVAQFDSSDVSLAPANATLRMDSNVLPANTPQGTAVSTPHGPGVVSGPPKAHANGTYTQRVTLDSPSPGGDTTYDAPVATGLELVTARAVGDKVTFPDGSQGEVTFAAHTTSQDLVVVTNSDGSVGTYTHGELDQALNAAPSVPAKKTTKAVAAKKVAAASAATGGPGKKMTNKLIYGKQANGTIMETTDGQHRMVYNLAGNNWTFQERTPDGGWKVIDILGKAASYQKAQELSQQWGPPHVGMPDELTPVPGPDSGGSGSFAPGWNVVSDPSLTSFKKMQILTMFKSLNNTPNIAPGTVAVNTANIAQTYGVDPETVLALVDQDSGNTNYSDMVQQHLNGNPFPDPMYPSPAKKTAAAKKLASTNAAAKKAAVAPSAAVPAPAPSTAPTPTVAPSPSSPSGGPNAPTPPAVTYTAEDNPYAQWINSAPVDLNALADQVALSTEVANARENLLALNNAGGPIDQISIATKKYQAAREKYMATYGTGWSPNHHTGLVGAYAEEAAGGAASPLPDGTPIPGLPPSGANIVVGSHVMMQDGTIGVAVGPGVGPSGESGVDVKLPDGTTTFGLGAYTIALKPEYVDQVKNAPPPGANVNNPAYGPGVVTGPPKANPQGVPYVPVTYASGTTTYTKVSSLTSMSATPPTPPSAPTVSTTHAIGTPVSTPNGPGYVSDTYLPENEATVTYPDGTKQVFTMDQLNEIDPSLVPKNTTPTPPPGFPPISNGTTVSTPAGVGKVVDVSAGGGFYKVQLANGSQVEVLVDDIAEVTPTSPPPSAHVPPTVSGLTYDANGVPQLSATQHAMVSAAFQNAGVNWYNPSDKLFDAAYEASQTTGLSIEDVLKFADANFHNSAKDGGKPIQTKIAKWAKSTKGKQHIQAKLGSPFIPTTTPGIVIPPAASTPGAPSTPSGGVAGGAALPGTHVSTTGIPQLKKNQAYTQFTSAMTSLNDSPGILAQKAANVAKKTGLTPEQVLAIVDEKKATIAGVPNGNLFSNKVLKHLNGKKWPNASTYSPTSSSFGGSTSSSSANTAFPITSGFGTVTPTQATQLQSSMVSASTPVTPAQTSSLRFYTSNNYTAINRCLRKDEGCTPALKNHIAQATAGMRPTTQNITTFRGTGFAAFKVDNIQELEKLVGKTVTEPGFSSTSISSGSAFSGEVAMQIEIPAGTPGAYVGNISHYKSEKEFLLPPGTKFRVLEVKPASGGKKAFVRVEVVPA